MDISGTGPIIVNGNVTGFGQTYGLVNLSTGVTTINGDCIAGTGGVYAVGCVASSSGPIIVTGNIINSTRTTGVWGTIIWAPSTAQKYVKFLLTVAGPTYTYASEGLGSDSGGTQITGANTAAAISTGKYFIKKDDGVYTQGTATGGGGGAWAQ
jgi:hypothetical protein